MAVETIVYPWTALDTQQQYVRVDLSVTLPARYPDVSPSVTLSNPRGLEDSTLASIEAQIHDKCEDYVGQPVIFEIINVRNTSFNVNRFYRVYVQFCCIV